MKTPRFISELKSKCLGERRIEPGFKFVAIEPPEAERLELHTQMRYSFEVTFGLKHWIREGASAREHQHIHEHFVRSLTKEVYGEVIEELHSVMDTLYAEGLYDTPATKQIEEIIKTLSDPLVERQTP